MNPPAPSSAPVIDFVPDPVPAPPVSQPTDTTGWQIVPATVRDERGFTIEDYEEAARDFEAEGDEEGREFATKAREKVRRLRAFLALSHLQGRN